MPITLLSPAVSWRRRPGVATPITFPPPAFAFLPAGSAPGSHTVDQPTWDGLRQATNTDWTDRNGASKKYTNIQDIYFNRWLVSRSGAVGIANAQAYNFVAAQGVTVPDHGHYGVSVAGGSMTAGISATLTLTPVPWGVNGADVGHSITINDGGATEVVTITGGTAVAGSSSGTITILPAHNHVGSTWTVGSATAGLYEAKNDLPTDLTKLNGALLLSNGVPQYFQGGAWQTFSGGGGGRPTQQDLSTPYNAGTLTLAISGAATILNVYRNGLKLFVGVHYTFVGGASTFTMILGPSSSLDDQLFVEWWA
jgi:hypothetical protein